MAAPTPIGANFITMFVNLNIVSDKLSQKESIGRRLLSLSMARAMPKIVPSKFFSGLRGFLIFPKNTPTTVVVESPTAMMLIAARAIFSSKNFTQNFCYDDKFFSRIFEKIKNAKK